MKLIQRTENLYELSMGMIKAFLIDNGRDLVLIDTGIKGKAEAILRAIDKAALDSSRLKHILITHLHSDHTGSLHDLKEKTSALVYAHNLEANAIEEGKILRDCVPAPSLMSQISVPLILKMNKDKRIMGTTVDVRLSDGDFLAIGGGIRVVFSPGHTIGHVSFLLQKEQNILITGDAAWGGKKPGYPLLFEDLNLGIQTLKMLGNMNISMALFSHGKGIPKEASPQFRERFSRFQQ